MRNIILSTCLLYSTLVFCQNSNSVVATINPVQANIGATLTFLSADGDLKTLAKEIATFRAKEYIINNIIGDTNGDQIKFETESLASDDSGGIISVAFNCNQVDKKGLLLAFFGTNRNQYGVYSKAYDFKFIPLEETKKLLDRIDEIIIKEKEYLSTEDNVNNIYIEYKDLKFVIYRDGLSSNVRVFWNGFEVVWEKTAFYRSKRRLTRWFN